MTTHDWKKEKLEYGNGWKDNQSHVPKDIYLYNEDICDGLTSIRVRGTWKQDPLVHPIKTFTREKDVNEILINTQARTSK